MSFVGQLSQFRLPDLLQMIATTEKSGKLTLTRRGGKGLVVLRNGKIIYAGSTTLPRETLGGALIGEELIEPDDLQRAIEAQRATENPPRLGVVLAELGLVDPADLERVIRQQVEKVLGELMEWSEGFFKFELIELAQGGEVEVDAKDFLLEEGVSAQHVLLSIAVRLDELERDRTEAPEALTIPEETQAVLETPSRAGSATSLTDITKLRSLIREVRSPEFTGEVTAQLLDHFRGVFRRGILFMVGTRRFDGMSGFGELSGAAGPIPAREISLPAGQPSVLREVVERGESFRGPLPFLPINRQLLHYLGGVEPSEAAVLPLSVNGRVMLVFYGDNLPDDDPIGPLEETDLLLLQMGLAMEKQLLAQRVSELEMMERLLHGS